MTSKTATRMVRLLSMVPWVIANPGTAADEVVTRFGYRDERELLADLNTVLVCGLPGYGPGDLMWASIEDGDVVIDAADYFSRPLRLTPIEALGLLAAGLAVESTGQAPEALGSAVAKLQAALLPDGGDVLVVDVEAEPELLAPLRQAVKERRALRLTYTSLGKGETTNRTVEPWTLFATMGNWYLTGFCREAEAERRFRVDRIRDLEVTDEVFPAPEQLPPPEVRYTAAEDDVVAKIRLGPQALWVTEYYEVDNVGEEPDGWSVVRFSAPDPMVAARLLVRLGSAAQLVEGDQVAAATEELRTAILDRYRR
jgi:proteasome accessory factor C